MTYRVYTSITNAIDMWYFKGLPPGSCTELLLRGQYDKAYLHAHPNIKPHWNDHVSFVENCVPVICRNENYDTWRGIEFEKTKVKLDNELFTI